jgi:hypothetical protein
MIVDMKVAINSTRSSAVRGCYKTNSSMRLLTRNSKLVTHTNSAKVLKPLKTGDECSSQHPVWWWSQQSTSMRLFGGYPLLKASLHNAQTYCISEGFIGPYYLCQSAQRCGAFQPVACKHWETHPGTDLCYWLHQEQPQLSGLALGSVHWEACLEAGTHPLPPSLMILFYNCSEFSPQETNLRFKLPMPLPTPLLHSWWVLFNLKS